MNSAAGSLGALVSQDLGLGDGEALEHGDSVEVKYTGWLWTDHGPGQVTSYAGSIQGLEKP